MNENKWAENLRDPASMSMDIRISGGGGFLFYFILFWGAGEKICSLEYIP